MDSQVLGPPNYNLNEQIYESSDKTIKIFKTRKRNTIQYMAVKVYHKKMHENYNYEHSILKILNHQNIVKCVGASEDNNYFFMELEYCMTGDLSKCLWQNKNCKYSEKIVKHVSTQILLALQYLHKGGFLHCNLKPSNILVDEYGNIRLCDFKKSLKINSITPNDIRKNKAAMTPCYTAPELFGEDGVYNHKTDLWALGCIMYELAVGQVPFFDESVGKLISKIINDEVNFNRKELQNYSDEFIDVLRKLLDKDPNTRVTWNELERHNYWELNLDPIDAPNNLNSFSDANSSRANSSKSSKKNITGNNFNAGNTGSVKDTNGFNMNEPNAGDSSKKKNVDILRLSRNALQNMMDDREDEYSRDKQKEVDNADQEFKFEGKDDKRNDDYDSSENNKFENDNLPLDKFLKLKNPLEVSVLNVSKVIKRDKRKNHYENELEKSIINNDDLPPFEMIILHQSDKIIKPIIGNKTIEVIPPTTFNKAKLPFQPWKLEKIREVCKNNNIKLMESYLLVIYSLMDQYMKGDEENLLNILNYFETIIQDKEIANNIINTSFITLFIGLLQKSKNDLVKIRVCSIIAYLIRYSTVIENPLDELGLNKILDLLIKDKNLDLAKKATATLGEYLFFVTTQAEGEEEGSSNWRISDESLSSLIYAIDLNRDDTIKFYAVKAIENITALTQIARVYFTSHDIFMIKLLELFNKSKNQELRLSAIYTISHLIRLEPALFKNLLEKKSLIEFKRSLEEEQPKYQQAILNCFILGVIGENQALYVTKNEFFPKFLAFLTVLLEQGTPIVKMKIILLLGCIIEDAEVISEYGEKFFHIIFKLRKENNNDLLIAIKVFEQIFISKIKGLIKNFLSILNRIKISSSANANVSPLFGELMIYLNCFFIIGLYPKISVSLFFQEFLDGLVKIIENNQMYADLIILRVYDILKIFSENINAVTENNDFVIKRMFLPILESSFNQQADNKITPLNICANMITLLLDDDRLYSSVVLEEGKTKQINMLIIQILPMLKEMLKIDELVFSSLSFLALIIERNSAFIRFYKTEKIVEVIFEMMKDANLVNNLNIIKIFIKLIEYQETSFDEIINMNLIDKVNILINSDNGDNIIYTEYIIELFYNLLYKINEQKKAFAMNMDKDEFKKFTNKIEGVARNFKLCITLLGHENQNIQGKACVSLIFLLQLFPDTYVESCGVYVKFTTNDIPELLKGLELTSSKIHKRVIRIFRWIIEFQNDAAQVLKPFISYIVSYIENIVNTSNDPEITQLASQLINSDLKNLSSK